MKTYALPFILLGILGYIDHINGEPFVCLGDSQIIGQEVSINGKKVNQYLSIPYAEPPIGNLRFMKTKPLKSLPTELWAVNQPPACPQYSKDPFPWYINSDDKKEDCLYLNIWTPADASPDNPKAVFYWIHGGGFRYGSIRDDVYSGIPLAALGDIIVVTVNYRLGAFGFLSSGTEEAPGNAAIWDILEGLKWVKRNIGFFGGDTSKITIAGESAGSWAVGLLSVSPLSKGLFTRKIMESGSPAFLTFDKSTQKNVKLAQQLAKLVGCSSDSYTIYDHPAEVTECLKSVDAITLSEAESFLEPHKSMDFLPQYGDEILPYNARLDIKKGKFHATESLMGVNRDEGSLLVSTGDPDNFGFFGQKDFNVNKTFGSKMLRKFSALISDPDAVVKYYLPDTIKENDYNATRYQVHTAVGDMTIVCPTVYYAEKSAEKDKQVYFYFWVHRPSNTRWAPWMGVAHFTEVQFVFGQPILDPECYEPEESEISLLMVEIWSSFVKNGKPSKLWPPYSKDYPFIKPLGSSEEMEGIGYGPHRKHCDFIRSFYGF